MSQETRSHDTLQQPHAFLCCRGSPASMPATASSSRGLLSTSTTLAMLGRFRGV